MQDTLIRHGWGVVASALKRHYVNALNRGTVGDLAAEDRAAVKRLLELGGIIWSISGRWIVRGAK